MASLIDDSGTTRFEGTITGAGGDLETATVLVSSAEILASFTTPIVVVPSPGPGRALVIVSLFGQLTGATVGYNSGVNQMGLFASTAIWQDMAVFTASATPLVASTNPVINSAIGLLADSPLVFTTLVADPTGGDGDLTLTVAFYVVTVA